MRVDLFDIEIESLRWFSTFTQRSLGEPTPSRSRPPPSSRRSTASWPRSPRCRDADERPDIAELLPVDRFHALLDLAPADAAVLIAAEEDIAPALADHWQDVCAAFHDEDAHHLYVAPDGDRGGARRARADPAVVALRRSADRVPRAGRRRRRALAGRGRARAREARALGLPHRRRFAAPRRGRARRLQPRAPARPVAGRRATPPSRRAPPTAARCTSRRATLRDGFVAPGLQLAVIPEHRLLRRRRAERTGGQSAAAAPPRAPALVHRPAHRRHRRARGPRRRALRRLRDQDRRRRHARLPRPRVRGHDKVFMPVDQLAKITRYVGAGGARPAALQARRQALGDDEGARPPRRAGAGRRAAQPLRRAQAPRRPRVPGRTPTGSSSSRTRFPYTRDARPARGDRGGQGRHGARRSRWTA